MTSLKIECLYCGHTYTETVYYQASIDKLLCPICKDSNLKKETEDKANANNDPFGYGYEEDK